MLTSSFLKMIHSHAVWIHRVNHLLIHQPKTNSSHVLESAFPYITFTTFHTSESRGLVEKKPFHCPTYEKMASSRGFMERHHSERMRKRGRNRNPVHRIWFSVDSQVNPRCSNNSCPISRLWLYNPSANLIPGNLFQKRTSFHLEKGTPFEPKHILNSFHKYVHDFFRVAFCFHQMGSLTIKKIHQLSPTTNIKHHLSSKSYPPEKLTTHPSTLKKTAICFQVIRNFSFFFQGGPFFFRWTQPTRFIGWWKS